MMQVRVASVNDVLDSRNYYFQQNT